MANTISFTDQNGYTLADINALFSDIATVLNAKVSRTDLNTGSAASMNSNRVINMAEAVDDDEIVTWAQLRRLAGT